MTIVKRENIILEKIFQFSLESIKLFRILQENKEFVISKQFLRSATSIGANVEESNAAQSKKDFVAKLAIASKEARETRYWLKLLDKSQIVTHDYAAYLISIEEIIKILTAIIKTSQENIHLNN